MQGPHRYDSTHQLSCFGAQLGKLGPVVSCQLRVLLLEVNIMLPLQISSLSPEAVHALDRSLLPGSSLQPPAHASACTCQAEYASEGGGGLAGRHEGVSKSSVLGEDWHCVRCGAKLGSSGCYCKTRHLTCCNRLALLDSPERHCSQLVE